MLELESKLIGMIYDAVLDEKRWSDVLEVLVAYTESKTAIFVSLDQLNPEHDFVYSHLIPEESLAAYKEERIKVIDMRLHTPLWQQAGVGGIVNMNLSSYALMPQESDEFIFYNKCLKPTGVCYIAAVLLDAGQYRWGVLGLHRASSKYEQRELDILRRLGTHLRRALQIYRQISLVEQKNQDLYRLLDCLKVGVILLDQYSQLIYSNHKAQNIIEKSELIKIDQFNRIKTIKEYQVKLNQYIESVLLFDQVENAINQFDSTSIGGVLVLIDQKTERKLMLSIVPCAKVLHQKKVGKKDSQRVAIFITETNQYIQLAKIYLKQSFMLSNREIQICELFVNGCKLEEIAKQSGLTLSSVRTYLKQIYAKTTCNTQAELMKFLLSTTITFEHIA
ncbi:helix-turn-helix transcriptional regulator [Acinetobacter haemolyticus]|uniref:helix-turn-helix transcriptional regulator n=1 Tax=Acinetobacter haemolyticus TaxID=29430 RepID=UPI002DBDE72B|nr:LuxR C-terminal-related transcriptional regulator [Acinetobacter haemolyticus]MEB6677820.1 LuxR C-terminal-related transcriptional regulator [Acinetobacter haemolyticus]